MLGFISRNVPNRKQADSDGRSGHIRKVSESMTKQELQAEALDRALQGESWANYPAIVQGFIDNGWITFYEGQGKPALDYDEVANQTTLKALHNLNPVPADGGDVEPGGVELSWTLPDPCVPGEAVSLTCLLRLVKNNGKGDDRE